MLRRKKGEVKVHIAQAKVIVNPVASGGKVGKQWPQLRETLLQGGLRFDAELTQYPGHASEIARKALDEGFRYFVAVGGDGTVHEVVNGLVVERRVPPEVTLSIIPGGTGSDFIRVLGISRDPTEACRTTLGHGVRAVDIGEIECVRSGKPITCYFVNVAGLGFDGEVCVRVNRMSKRISGTLPYLTGLVLTLLSYANKDVQLTVDGQPLEGRMNSVVVCNGQYFGGGMWVGPQAAADDGIFDVVLLKDLNKVEFLLNVPRVYKGTHLTHPKVQSLQGREVHVEAKQRMFIQAEGELVGEAPATFRLIPGALNLRV
jgi:diacylglycerol kinase (ATP)